MNHSQSRRRTQMMVFAGFVSVLHALPVKGQLEVSTLEMVLVSGAAAGSFTVHNVSGASQTVTLRLEDWSRAETGSNVFDAPGKLSGSCSPNVSVFPMTLQLRAEESQGVRVSYTGAPVTTSCWIGVAVGAVAAPSHDSSSMRLQVQIEHLIKIYVEPVAPQRSIAIDSLDIVRAPPPDTMANRISVLVRGTGNAQARVHGRVEYRTAADSVVAKTVIDNFPVLPGAKRRLLLPLQTVPPGRYVVLVMLDYGGPELIAGQIDLEVRK